MKKLMLFSNGKPALKTITDLSFLLVLTTPPMFHPKQARVLGPESVAMMLEESSTSASQIEE
ncbi:hypothetical protein CUMW_246070 [Citrus unshiu]|uniref:Uncharacterized protein n=1 Tax=Citrus unshiu TaxID=55188 RepID=A0A2H5QNA9_CITUN|nr:hypothetical protein CUMW_246070 [Citrus unshiu]